MDCERLAMPSDHQRSACMLQQILGAIVDPVRCGVGGLERLGFAFFENLRGESQADSMNGTARNTQAMIRIDTGQRHQALDRV